MKKTTLLLFILFILARFTATAQMTLTFTPSNHNGYAVSCFGGSDGVLTVDVVSGGTPPYTYLWSNGATTKTITALTANYYSVIVTDANSNSTSDGKNIGSPKEIVISLTSPTYGNLMN